MTSRPGKTHRQARTGNITSSEDAIPPCTEVVNHITAAPIEIAIVLQWKLRKEHAEKHICPRELHITITRFASG